LETNVQMNQRLISAFCLILFAIGATLTASAQTTWEPSDKDILALRNVAAVEGLPKWQRALLEFLQRNARSLPDDLGIRRERRVELGLSVEL